MRKIDEILRLHKECGMGIRQIARSCQLSHSTVREYLGQLSQSGKVVPQAGGKFRHKGSTSTKYGYTIRYHCLI
jgi:predicted transcriptional regulator